MEGEFFLNCGSLDLCTLWQNPVKNLRKKVPENGKGLLSVICTHR